MSLVEVTAADADRKSRDRVVRRLLVTGLAGLYLAWILVIPPFAGSDEFDHAYRAAAAARGQWNITPTDATRGTGAWLLVPRDIVKAAQPECQARIYTKGVDCRGTRHGDRERIASGAGRYHPLFYAVIGWPALPFSGDTALYVMRLTAAAISLAFVWAALAATQSWSRTRWGPVGVAVACSPVVIYSGAIAAPNGVEMTSALALWCGLVGLAVAPAESVKKLLLICAVSGATLCTLRPLGPLWCLLVLAAVLVGVERVPDRLRGLLRGPWAWVTGLVVAASALQAVAWTLSKGALSIGVEGTFHTTLAHRLWVSTRLEPLWMLQSIAAFPLRDQPTHPVVYACYLILFFALLIAGFLAARGRLRVAIVLVVLATMGIPFASTVTSYDKYLAAWQGRYGLALSIGLVVLAATALDRAGRPMRGPWWLAGGILFVIAQTVSVVHTLAYEVHESPLAGTPSWLEPSYAVATVLAGLAAVTVWLSTSVRRSALPGSAEEPALVSLGSAPTRS